MASGTNGGGWARALVYALTGTAVLMTAACGSSGHSTGSSSSSSTTQANDNASHTGAQPAGDTTPLPCPAMSAVEQATDITLGTDDPNDSPPSYCGYQHVNGSAPDVIASLRQPAPQVSKTGLDGLAQAQAVLSKNFTLVPQPALGSGAFQYQPIGAVGCTMFFLPPGHATVVEAQVIVYPAATGISDACSATLSLAKLLTQG